MRHGNTLDTASSTTTTTGPPPFSAPAIVQRSPWHSPMPYLFGGLAAMLGLITFALLILACSYWKLTSRLNNNGEDDGDDRRDLEAGDHEKPDSSNIKTMPIFEEKIVVIMAGDVKPTFLATPMAMKAAASFDDGNEKSSGKERVKDDGKVEKQKEEISDHDQGSTTTSEKHPTQESQEQNQ